MKILIAINCILIAGFFVYSVIKDNRDLRLPTQVIKTNTVIQYRRVKPIILEKIITNIKIRTNRIVVYLASNLSEFLSKPGWIAVSNKPAAIWAGLHTRSWYMPISIKRPSFNRNEAGLLFGTGIGAYYSRSIFKKWKITGIVFIQDNRAGAMAGAGYKF
jgi:hypothetical protein